MSLSNSFPIGQENAKEETPEKSGKAAEPHFDLGAWLKTSLENQKKSKTDGDYQAPDIDIEEQELSTPEGFLKVLTDVSERYGKKRLFVCCDGTWLNASGTVAPLSNVAKLARSVQRMGADKESFQTIGGVPQLVYYSSGVGTQSTLQMDSNVAAVTGKGTVLVDV
jgi:hypothetical protein